jgi:hypothetical protein
MRAHNTALHWTAIPMVQADLGIAIGASTVIIAIKARLLTISRSSGSVEVPPDELF